MILRVSSRDVSLVAQKKKAFDIRKTQCEVVAVAGVAKE